MALSNSQFTKIKKIYDDRQLARHYEKERRLTYVNEHIDGFREVNESIASLCVKQASLLLDGQAFALSDLKESIRILKEQKALLLKNASLPEDYLDVPYICPDCQDTGYIDNEKCHCFQQKIIDEMYQQSILRTFWILWIFLLHLINTIKEKTYKTTLILTTNPSIL